MQVPKIGGLSGRLADRVSRRRLIQGSAGGVATSALVAASGVLDEGNAIALAQATPEPQTHELTLTASEFDWDLMADVRVRVWGYNGQLPGPELRVTEGDTVRVTLKNELPVPTTIHWHGLNVPNAMDGVAGLNQAPVKPGETFTYEFIATPAGTRWYHSHTDPALQVPMGLYGALVVEPRQPEATYDREYTLMLAEWDTELTPGVAAGTDPIGPKDAMLRGGELGADLFLINGKMHGAIPPLMVAEGERVLVRLIHTGAIPHPIHTHGHSFQIVATDGNPVPEMARLTKDTVLIGPAERYDLAFTADNPGVWMVHCHIEHHMANGMMTTIWYEGYQPTGPAADAAVAEATMAAMPAMHHADMETPTPTPAAATPVSGDVFVIAMVDDRFDPAEATIPAGTTVAWVNKGRNWHSVASFDGSFESGKIKPGDRFTHQFTSPGTFKYICKHHGMQGMLGVITVVAASG
jgi:FtsP/CotA-like multicopper oxidase with cupredoxin domain